MADLIIVVILAVVVAAAVRYIYKAKKSGAKCIGCSGGSCHCCSSGGDSASCGGCCPSDKT